MGALVATWPASALGQHASSARTTDRWDAGRVRHLLPTVSDSRFLIKTSFTQPLSGAPTLVVGDVRVPGRMNDTAGECWQFYATGLQPARRYRLSLTAADGSSLCEPWDLSTFPAPDARPERFRVVFFTCAGGPESDSLTRGNLPTPIRNRLLRRGLSFEPDAIVANGDHIYWDLHAPRLGPDRMLTARYREFDHAAPVFGTRNEDVLKRVAAPQILPVYSTDFRSTPVFFLQDDHDHFDNDEAWDFIITFPPPWFQIQLARATQQMYYPEFLPDAARPANLPWSSSSRERGELSESFGTLRYGRLAEVLLYDVRRTMTLAGPSAVFVDPEVEAWLRARTADSDAAHVIHAPSNPWGWTAGKWGEWYPDVLDANTELTDRVEKPVLADGLARTARSARAGARGLEPRVAIDDQRRPARDRRGADPPLGQPRSHAPSDRRDPRRPGRHGARRLAVGVPRRRARRAEASRRGRGGEADRAARLRGARLHARGHRRPPVPLGREDDAGRGDRHARAVLHDRTGPVGSG